MNEIINVEPKIIGQGAYGCVFKPGINCQGKTESDIGYISKLQTSGETLENELSISKKIQTIEDYTEYFSPILEKCPIKIEEIETKEINSCKISELKNPEKSDFFLDKVKFVGNNSLEKYLKIMIKGEPKKFIELFLETQIVLLESLEKLNEIKIIHNDLKEDNIICRDGDGRPIIIDFGLSMDNEYLEEKSSSIFSGGSLFSFLYSKDNNSQKEETSLPPPKNIQEEEKEEKEKEEKEKGPKGYKLSKYFFKYKPEYEVWCIDILLINYISNILNKDKIPSSIEIGEIDKIVNEYINKNTIFTTSNNNNSENVLIDDKEENETNLFFTKEEKEKFKNDLLEDFKVDKFPSWENLLNVILTYQKTWDNYALSVVYLRLLTTYKEEISKEINEKYEEYIKILKSVILSKPSERKLPEIIKQDILQALQKRKREQFIENIM